MLPMVNKKTVFHGPPDCLVDGGVFVRGVTALTREAMRLRCIGIGLKPQVEPVVCTVFHLEELPKAVDNRGRPVAGVGVRD